MIAAAMAGVAGYLLINFIVSGLLQDWQQTKTAIRHAQTQYLRTLTIVRNAASWDQNKQAANVSNSIQTADFLREIESAAGAQVKIRRFHPLHSTNENHSSSKSGTQRVVKLQIQIECSGNLPALMAFFERIENQNVLTRIRHFYLTPEGRGSDQLQCQLILVRMLAV